MSEPIEAAGQTECAPDLQWQVRPAVKQRVIAVLVRDGQPVAKSEVLARLDDRAATRQVSLKKAALEKAQAQREMLQAQLGLRERLRARGASSEEEVEGARAAVSKAAAEHAVARVEHEAAEQDLDDCQVKAPGAGVFRRDPEAELTPGALADPGQAWGTIHDVSRHIEVTCQLKAGQARRVRAGQAVEVRRDAKKAPVASGEVVFVGWAHPNGEGPVPVVVRVANDPAGLHFGEKVRVRFTGASPVPEAVASAGPRSSRQRRARAGDSAVV
jgi:RND family efflux transporter MFP subunit